jgi:capsular polysaccharide transport system permease protein
MATIPSIRHWLRRHLMFTLFVVIPGALIVVYYALLASDIYVSESRFLVRSPQKGSQSTSMFGQLLLGTGISHSADDTFAVRDYILSRDALQTLQSELNIREMYSRPGASLIDRFPGLSWDRSFEEFFRYYGKHVVTIELDSQSSIATLTVRAFTAEDAYRINSRLIEMSERLVNELNDRSRQDMIRFASNEVAIASDKAKDASVALLNYRSNAAVFQPDKQAALQLEQVAHIQQQLISTEAEIAQLVRLSPDNPQISALKGRAESLRGAIASEAAKVTSSRNSFSANAPDFERRQLDVEFADKQLGVALAELESARSDAQQKQLYLERLVQPSLPDKAMEPRRIRSIIALIVMTLVIWGVASVVVASVREHGD